MQLSLFAIVLGVGVVLLVNVAVLGRQSSSVLDDLLDTRTLQRVQSLLVDCQPKDTAETRCDNSSVPRETLSCPPQKNASAEVLAQAKLIMELKQNDFQQLRNEYASIGKLMAEQKTAFQMAIDELKSLRVQIMNRDLELERLVPRKPVPAFRDPVEPTAEQLTAWSNAAPEAEGLRKANFFNAANWKTLHTVLVIVATGQVNHGTRAKLHLNSWIKLMPNASNNVIFSSDRDDGTLSPVPVLALPNDEQVRGGFQAAQKRFIRALAAIAERDFERPPKFVYLMDDDAFMHVPHMAALVTMMEGSVNASHFYAEMCGEVGSVNFACGGGGMFLPYLALRRAWRALRSCHLALSGQMGQYDVAVSHCLEAAGISGLGMPQFCSQPPLYYMPNGKGGWGQAGFLKAVSFHYVTALIPKLHSRVVANLPLWPYNY